MIITVILVLKLYTPMVPLFEPGVCLKVLWTWHQGKRETFLILVLLVLAGLSAESWIILEAVEGIGEKAVGNDPI